MADERLIEAIGVALRSYVPPAIRARYANARAWQPCEDAITAIATEVAEHLERTCWAARSAPERGSRAGDGMSET